MNEIPEFDENSFQDLITTAKNANFTAEEIHRYTEEQKMSNDYQNCLNYAVETAVEAAVKTATEKALSEGEEKGKAEGLAEGLAEGKNEVRCEMARNLLKEGLSMDLICRTTGLSEEEVLKLK